MGDQLTKKKASTEKDAADETVQKMASVEVALSDAELQALLDDTRTGLLRKPVPRNMQRYSRILALLTVDIMAFLGALWVSYWLRFETAFVINNFPAENFVTLGEISVPLLFLSPFLIIALKISGMYEVHTRVNILDKIPRIMGAVNAYIVLLLLCSFLLSVSVINKGFLVIFWILSILFLFIGRTTLQLLYSTFDVSDVIMSKTLIIGSGKVGAEVARKLKRHPAFGLRPIGFIDDDPLYTEFEDPSLKDMKVLGKTNDLCRILRDFDVEKVIIAFSKSSSEELLDLASKCNKMGVDCSIVPRLFEIITNEITVKEIGGIPLIRIRKKKIEGVNRVLKWMEDYILSALVVLITWPLLLVTAIAIKIDSPGPVFFRQKRVGRDGTCFNCIKFRSMVENAEELQCHLQGLNESEGPLFKIREDPRITRVGKLIRKFSIDEIPQVFNVLSGDMSLVGPRPLVQSEVDLYKECNEFKEWHKQRFNAKPGITGLWQVSGRCNIPYDEMIKYDLYYIERWSLWLDCKIMLRTFLAVFSGAGAC
jgi:exopolysaccharide biosynthesis polyprenyl glycosylphosphotransferase